MPYPIVLVTGDSIAQQSFKIGGYGSALVDQYQGNYDVLNRGMGGYNSTQLLQRFQEGLDLPAGADVRLVIIHIGTNDCVKKGYQYVSVTKYKENLSAIISHVRTTHPKASIIFLTPSTVVTSVTDALERTIGMPEEFITHRTPTRAKEFADACLSVAQANDVKCLDVYSMHEGKEGFFTDGLHYTPEGYQPVSEALIQLIAKSFPSLIPDPFPRAFPMFATYGRDGSDSAQRYAEAIEEIGRRMREQAEAQTMKAV